ncbi:SIR2 family protein [Erysipelothrix rhusiopathiae]|nr:SIR2 family protein [Erysipelothrix rhusiopathiae]
METVTNEALVRYICEIKKEFFSRSNFPKFIIGTGLSVSYNVAGMDTLSQDFETHFESNTDFSEIWPEVKEIMSEKGLEAALQAPIISKSKNGNKFIECITSLSSKRVLTDTRDNIETIKNTNRGFMKLISYLAETVSRNDRLIDIMTPNYDLIIELVCEEVGVGIIDGFSGEYYQTFAENELSEPRKIFRLTEKPYVRLMKPHGSINWVSTSSGMLYKVNDFGYLFDHINELQIIAPGAGKYEMGMTGAIFTHNREIFNNILRSKNDCPLVIYGYGFNDEHFNLSIIENSNQKILVLSFNIKEDILIRLQKNSKAVAFYQKEGKNYMLYKSHTYKIERGLWDLDELVSQMVA